MNINTKYPLLLYSGGVDIMDGVINTEITMDLKGKNEFKASFFKKTDNIDTDSIIQSDGMQYDIVYAQNAVDANGNNITNVEGYHVGYRLSSPDIALESFADFDTPQNLISQLISGTEFTVGTVDFTTPVEFFFNEKTTIRSALYLLALQLGGEIEYNNFEINLVSQIGSNTGFSFQERKNLRGMRVINDKRTGSNVLSIEVDITEMQNSDEYKRKGYDQFETFGLGDTCKVKSSKTGIDTLQRVVAYKYNPVKKINSIIQLSEKVPTFTDRISALQSSSVIKGRTYNNVEIDPAFGFRSTLSDGSARATYGGDEISMDVSDGLGGWIQAVYFDPVDGKYKFVGDIDASGIITGAEIIGSRINNGAGTFLVDELGNVTANSLTIGGGSGISNLSDAGDLATLSSVSSTYIDDGAVITPKLAAGAVVASKISVDELSAISADIGEVTAGTVTGVRFRTSSSGERIEISGDDLNTYNSSNELNGFQLESGKNYSTFDAYNDDILIGSISVTNSNGMVLSTFTESTNDNIIINASGDLSLIGNKILANGVEIPIAVIAGNGMDVSYSSGLGGYIIDIDPSEVSGNGIQEDSNGNFEIDLFDIDGTGLRVDGDRLELDLSYTDDRYCVNESSNEMGFQEFSDDLEVFQNGVLTHTIPMIPV